jgi:hypothetical protein
LTVTNQFPLFFSGGRIFVLLAQITDVVLLYQRVNRRRKAIELLVIKLDRTDVLLARCWVSISWSRCSDFLILGMATLSEMVSTNRMKMTASSV